MSLKFSIRALLAGVALVSVQALAADVIEFYHEGLDHYFVTSSATEIQALDSGKIAGWARTGFTFQVFNAGSASLANSVPVCRFYGNPERGLDSHVYSLPAECAKVKVEFPDDWLLEADEVFRVHAVNATTGLCPSNTKPVYRLWNQRLDSNHRYTTDSTVVDSMVAKGYKLEGSGNPQRPIVFCAANIAPAQPVAGAPICTITSSAAIPALGTPVTLTATCTNSPTSYSWINCTSTTNTCTATATTAGTVNYGVIGTNARGSSAPAMLALNWQNAASATPTCTVAASSATPTLGSSLVLTANCSHTPSQFDWLKCSALLIDACNPLSECSATASTCSPVSAQAGAIYYAVVARNTAGASPKAGVAVNWQSSGGSGPPPPTGSMPSCTISASSTSPAINSTLTLTASCTNTPTAYQWSNCSSTTAVCQTSSTSAGARTYALTASNAFGVSTPASVVVNWQLPPTAPPVCTLSASNPTPTVGNSVTLTANCTQSPTIFQWTGCSSTGSTCTASSSTAGAANYSVVAGNQFGQSSPASTSVNWQASTPPAQLCQNYSNVIYVDLNWGSHADTVQFGSVTAGTMVVGRLRIPTNALLTGKQGRVSWVEYSGGTYDRVASLSTVACDHRGFSPPSSYPTDPNGASFPFKWGIGQTGEIGFGIAGGAGSPQLQPGQTYYVNIRTISPFTGQELCTGTKKCELRLTVSVFQ